MNNKRKLKTIILVLGIGFAFLTILTYDLINDQRKNKNKIEFYDVTDIKIAASNITIITPENKTYYKPMSGFYPATYGFENDQDGADPAEWVIVSQAGNAQVISELDIHKKVLRLHDSTSGSGSTVRLSNSFTAQDYGTIELWMLQNDLGDNDDIGQITGRGNDTQIFRLMMRGGTPRWQVSDNGTIGDISGVPAPSINTWYHIRIDFEHTMGGYQGLNQNEYYVAIDGIRYGPFLLDANFSLNELHLHTYSWGATYDVYFDAVGYSWDMDYNTGDNLNEGFLLSFTNTTQLNWMGYSLDDHTNRTILGNTTIQFQIGSHKLQVFGTDTLGTVHNSDVRHFSCGFNLTGNPIFIDDTDLNFNWSKTAAENPWCTGSGTWDDPYLIEYVTIDGQNQEGSRIYIANSKNNYFIIRHCTIYNGGIGNLFLEEFEAGIKLENVNNGILFNNNCSNNLFNGIGLFNFCENNKIINNILNNNERGVNMMIFCENNTIQGNSVIDNVRGICLIDYCDNNTIIENVAMRNDGLGGIYLKDCDYNKILENSMQNNKIGINLQDCDENIISENSINDGERGITLVFCDDNIISGNTIDKLEYSMNLGTSCDNIILGNSINDGERGIYLGSKSDDNIISENIINNAKSWRGIRLWDDCDGNTILRNIINNGTEDGIILELQSDSNIISENIVTNNTGNGIHLGDDCNANILSRNLVYTNGYGIVLDICQNNRISSNYIFNNTFNNAIDSGGNINYWDNGIIGNYWGNYSGTDIDQDGIGDTPHNIPGGTNNKDNKPIMNYNPFFFKSPNDLTYEIGTEGHSLTWIIINTSPLLYSFNVSREGTSINTGLISDYVSEIKIDVDNLDENFYKFTLGVNNGSSVISSDDVWVTVINTASVFTGKPNNFSYEVGDVENNLSWAFTDVSTKNSTYTIVRNGVPIIIGNPCAPEQVIEISIDGLEVGSHEFNIEVNDGYGGAVQDSVWVKVINTLPIFTVIPSDFSYDVGDVGNNLSWIFSDVSTINPTYTITRNNIPLINDIPCVSGQVIEIFIDGLEVGLHGFIIELDDGYGGTIQDSVWVTVNSSSIPPLVELLYLEIVDQSFSTEEFNITFSVYNGTSQGIDFATIQLWWNEIDASSDIKNFGSGLYFISLDPITVAPGEDPILLDMIISADGYQDKHFEMYLAVDPDTLEKEVGESAGEFPFIIIIIAITSLVGGIGVVGITLVLLRKRKRVSEAK